MVLLDALMQVVRFRDDGYLFTMHVFYCHSVHKHKKLNTQKFINTDMI